MRINTHKYLTDPDTPTAKAFFEGAHAMIDAIAIASQEDRNWILSSGDLHHVISVLLGAARQKDENHRNDARNLLSAYNFDKERFMGLLLDRYSINHDGVAVNEDRVKVEDLSYRLISDQASYWPEYEIRHYLTDDTISRHDYEQLSDEEKEDYSYVKFMSLTFAGRPTVTISDTDRHLMEEMLRQVIHTEVPGFIRRILVEAASFDETTQKEGKLYRYREAIFSAMDELASREHNARITPTLMANLQHKHIKTGGQMIIAELQALSHGVKPGWIEQASAAELDYLGQIIGRCTEPDFGGLILDSDIETYEDLDGASLPGLEWYVNCDGVRLERNLYGGQTLEQQKLYLRNKLIPLVCDMLIAAIREGVRDGHEFCADRESFETLLRLHLKKRTEFRCDQSQAAINEADGEPITAP